MKAKSVSSVVLIGDFERSYLKDVENINKGIPNNPKMSIRSMS